MIFVRNREKMNEIQRLFFEEECANRHASIITAASSSQNSPEGPRQFPYSD